MTEAREIEEIVAWMESEMNISHTSRYIDFHHIAALISDWRAKKDEIERLRASLVLADMELDVAAAYGRDLAKRMATTGRDAAEATRAKCEAIARKYYELRTEGTSLDIAETIAALAAPQSNDLTTS